MIARGKRELKGLKKKKQVQGIAQAVVLGLGLAGALVSGARRPRVRYKQTDGGRWTR